MKYLDMRLLDTRYTEESRCKLKYATENTVVTSQVKANAVIIFIACLIITPDLVRYSEPLYLKENRLMYQNYLNLQ